MNTAASRSTLLRVGTAMLAAIIALAFTYAAGVYHVQTAVGAKATPNVHILGKRLLKQGAGVGGGNARTLLTIGTLVHRSICIDEGSDLYTLQHQVRSSKGGGKLLSGNGFNSLTSEWQDTWSVSNTGPAGFSEGYDVLYPDGTFRHFQVDLFVHGLGSNCVSRIVATNA